MKILTSFDHKDSDIIDLNLRSIYYGLVTIKQYTLMLVSVNHQELREDLSKSENNYLLREGLSYLPDASTNLVNDAIRARMLDIEKAANILLKIEGLPQVVIDTFNLTKLSVLDVGVSNYYAKRDVAKFMEYFKEKFLDQLLPVYIEEFKLPVSQG